MATVVEDGASFPYRLYQIEKKVDELTRWQGAVDTERGVRGEQMSTMSKQISTLVASVDSLRRVILGFALTIAASAVAFSLTVLIATGKLGG